MPDYIPDFDYGGDIAEKQNSFKLWPTIGSKTGLVDADLLPYRVGFVLDELKYLEAKSLVEEGAFGSVRETPQFEDAFEQLCCMLNRWLNECSCDSAILYSTHSSSNFRLDIAFSDCYKGQRLADKPPFFSELKQEMTDRLDCILCKDVEADDYLSIEAWRRFRLELEPQGIIAGSSQHKELCDVVVISSDKDSTITPCFNYNPDTKVLRWVDSIGCLLPKYKKAMIKKWEVQGTGEFNFVWEEEGTGEYFSRGARQGMEKTRKVKVNTTEKTKRVCIGETPSTAIEDLKGTGLKFFYSQIITGDMADNYKGLKGKGATLALSVLDNCTTERQLYEATLKCYQEHYGMEKQWVPNYQGTEDYYDNYMTLHGKPPEDFDYWRGKGAYLSAFDRMMEQGRLAWMQTYLGDIWRKDRAVIINPHDKGGFWNDPY